jgi:hypothetical protein
MGKLERSFALIDGEPERYSTSRSSSRPLSRSSRSTSAVSRDTPMSCTAVNPNASSFSCAARTRRSIEARSARGTARSTRSHASSTNTPVGRRSASSRHAAAGARILRLEGVVDAGELHRARVGEHRVPVDARQQHGMLRRRRAQRSVRRELAARPQVLVPAAAADPGARRLFRRALADARDHFVEARCAAQIDRLERIAIAEHVSVRVLQARDGDAAAQIDARESGARRSVRARSRSRPRSRGRRARARPPPAASRELRDRSCRSRSTCRARSQASGPPRTPRGRGSTRARELVACGPSLASRLHSAHGSTRASRGARHGRVVGNR